MTRLIDTVKTVLACPPAALTGAAGDGDYVSLKDYFRARITIAVKNATTVTGGAVTLKQAKDVSGGSEAPLAFSKIYANVDTAASDTLVETAVVGNTFTTDTTNSKNLLYVIDISASDLDVNNGFDCVRIDVASMANAVGSVTYDLYEARYASPIDVSAITD